MKTPGLQESHVKLLGIRVGERTGNIKKGKDRELLDGSLCPREWGNPEAERVPVLGTSSQAGQGRCRIWGKLAKQGLKGQKTKKPTPQPINNSWTVALATDSGLRELKEAHRKPPQCRGWARGDSDTQHTNLSSAHNPHSSEREQAWKPRQVHTRPAT